MDVAERNAGQATGQTLAIMEMPSTYAEAATGEIEQEMAHTDEHDGASIAASATEQTPPPPRSSIGLGVNVSFLLALQATAGCPQTLTAVEAGSTGAPSFYSA